MQTISKVWKVAPQIKHASDEAYHWAIAQILKNRDIVGKQAILDFLDPDLDKLLHDPFKFRDMQAAVDLIIKHVIARNKIMIYGDYDADGVTSSVVLAETLSTLKAEVDVYIPDRVKEGYGLNKDAIKQIAEKGFRLIITVDGGIRSRKEVDYAKQEGIDVIITDHHLVPDDPDDLPRCLIINPAVPEEVYPFKKLAGVGVAFKLATAIISKTKLPNEDKVRLENRILDLVAIGTVADCVILRGENRILTKKGLDLINNKKQRIGLQELMKIAGLTNDPNRKIDAGNIAFQIAPRINAAGRMEKATTAFELLITRGPEEAQAIAHQLNERNIERQEQTQSIVDELDGQIKQAVNDKIIICICPETSEWNEGVIGLVASKVMEKYGKPTLVIAKTADGYKGSGRSIPIYNVVEALNAASGCLEKYGGHPAACGFSLKKEKINKFKEIVTTHANETISNESLAPIIDIDVEIELDEINLNLINEIERIAPFGQGNPRPMLVSKFLIIADVMTMGMDSQHIKFKLTNGKSGIINALGFSQAEKWKDLVIGDRIDLVYYLEINDFNGRREMQMKIVDIKKV
ncbi:MAG: single-stranded-DNA-specific exonuclease RecJ [Candidatus Falkowbacteria bacterium]|nr:single-stranded-DNA-specific exonuclease RecJ [Candidatus Falkowbacteria bacterium]